MTSKPYLWLKTRAARHLFKKTWLRHLCYVHRYLMTRLSLQVFYLWRHVWSTAPPLIFWWTNLEILVGPLHRNSPFIGELRCQALQMEHGPHITEKTQKAVYIVRCLWLCCRYCVISSPLPRRTEFRHGYWKIGRQMAYILLFKK
jgi:hypothetical protein